MKSTLQFNVKPLTAEILDALEKLAESKGFKRQNSLTFPDYPVFWVGGEKKEMEYGRCAENSLHGRLHRLSIEEAVWKLTNYTPPKQIEVVLNDEHTATVTSDGIQVGCQTFPLSVVDKLKAAVEKMRK